MSQMEVETDVKEDDNPEGGSAMDVEHDNTNEEKLKRQATPHPSCSLSVPQLQQDGYKLMDFCPICKEDGVLCRVGRHKQPQSSAPSSVPSPVLIVCPCCAVVPSNMLSAHIDNIHDGDRSFEEWVLSVNRNPVAMQPDDVHLFAMKKRTREAIHPDDGPSLGDAIRRKRRREEQHERSEKRSKTVQAN